MDNSFLIIGIALLGLIIGSFLNVVIYRLPQELSYSFNLFVPRSHCPSCKNIIAWYYNIPVISYLILHGRCAICHNHISKRYPLVELLSCIASIIVFLRFGISWQTLIVLILTWSLIASAFIDFEHLILPDLITLPLLWFGLFVNTFHLFTDPSSAIIGAIVGYSFFWIIAKIFYLIRKIEGVGYGDFKLLAMFGAWLGWQKLPIVVLIASIIGAVIGIIVILRKKYSWQYQLPFGPYLIFAGWFTLIFRSLV